MEERLLTFFYQHPLLFSLTGIIGLIKELTGREKVGCQRHLIRAGELLLNKTIQFSFFWTFYFFPPQCSTRSECWSKTFLHITLTFFHFYYCFSLRETVFCFCFLVICNFFQNPRVFHLVSTSSSSPTSWIWRERDEVNSVDHCNGG